MEGEITASAAIRSAILPILGHDADGNLTKFEIIAISMQGFYFLAFVIPSLVLLLKKWEFLDNYSRWMIILYQSSMTIKLAFYIMES